MRIRKDQIKEERYGKVEQEEKAREKKSTECIKVIEKVKKKKGKNKRSVRKKKNKLVRKSYKENCVRKEKN